MRVWQSQKTRALAIGLLATVGAFFVFRSGNGRGPAEPLDAVPKESFLVATVDVSELRRSPVYDVLLGKGGAGGAKALALSGLEKACGFDPFTRIERLALAVPEKEGDRDFGLAARVTVSRDELATCKKRLEEERGSSGSSEAKERGSFLVIDGVRAGGSTGSLAYGRGDLLVVSHGEWFDAMLAAANGERPSVRDAKDHADLRAALTSHEGWRLPTILVTAVLPRALRDRIRGEMAPEGDGPQGVMAGVLGVSAVGLAVRAGPPGGHVDARIEMTCDTADACAAVAKLIQKKRLDWSKDLMIRMLGFGALVDSLETHAEGTRLEATTSANADALANSLDRILRLRTADRGPAPLEPRPAEKNSAVPHETIRARDGGPGG